jgi:hypothetical protein
MAFTEIEAAELGTAHLGRQIQVSWQMDDRGATFRTSLHGVLEYVAHSSSGTSVAVNIGPMEVSLDNMGLQQARVEVDLEEPTFGR